ncbi:hypothetical protein GCM10007923_27840 [Shinella yambaruensis]|uniref:Uncharacterized protein n=1 Tax=Shinella yambaruensis TaxID=415996 RepID=A0ABQ5ZJ24_9HYPH|nr:hypothetical protein GCM10007923_27840 [Shinella yambaruensis]
MGELDAGNGDEEARKGGKAETQDKVTHGRSAQIGEGMTLPNRRKLANRRNAKEGGLSSRPGLVENAPDEAILAQLG